jgi:hypothetical protein
MKRFAMFKRTAGQILGGLCAIMVAGIAVDVAQAGETAGIPPEMVAEYIHAVVQADRTLYSTHVVERLQDLKIPVAVEEWKSRGTLPLPAQMLQMAGQEIQGLGLGLRIRLASLGPIYKKTGLRISSNERAWKRWQRIPGSPIRASLPKVTNLFLRRYLRIGPFPSPVSRATTAMS